MCLGDGDDAHIKTLTSQDKIEARRDAESLYPVLRLRSDII